MKTTAVSVFTRVWIVLLLVFTVQSQQEVDEQRQRSRNPAWQEHATLHTADHGESQQGAYRSQGQGEVGQNWPGSGNTQPYRQPGDVQERQTYAQAAARKSPDSVTGLPRTHNSNINYGPDQVDPFPPGQRANTGGRPEGPSRYPSHAQSPRPQERTTLSPVLVSAAISSATTQFSVDVFKKLLRKTRDNVVVSPMSVQTLLAMLQQGAVDRSAVQLENVIHMSPSTSRAGYSAAIKQFARHRGELTFANKIFVKQSYNVNPNYTKILRDDFNSGVQKLTSSNSESVKMINDWVKTNTNDLITEIVKPGDITSATRLVLANAIHFRAEWLKTFSPEETVDEFFYTSPTTRVDAQMMFQISLFSGGVNDELKARWVELFYENRDFSMIVVLPTESHKLDHVIDKLTPQSLRLMIDSSTTYEVNLKMPRYKIKSDSSFRPLLAEMGLTDVFGRTARLDGITNSKSTLFVTDILHSALLHVTEEGTEAAGSSALYGNTLSIKPTFEKMDFNMTEPFLAIIVHREGADISKPIFMARISNPGLDAGDASVYSEVPLPTFK